MADGTSMKPSLGHSVSLVCYGYNEEAALPDFFQRAVGTLEAVTSDYEVIFIDDASTDRTWDIAQTFSRENNRIRAWRNDSNRDIGFCFKRAVALAEKEYLFWQTVDWSYDLTHLHIFLELLDHFGVVIGVRPVPIRLLSHLPVVKSIYRVRTRSDDPLRAVVSLTNYYVLRILFGVDAHDFQNLQFHRTKVLQSFQLRGESSFLGIEMMIRASNLDLDLIEVPIRFIPRTKGTSKGIRPAAIWRSCRDIATNWLSWGWRLRLTRPRGQGRIFRLAEPAALDERVIVLCAPLFKQYQ